MLHRLRERLGAVPPALPAAYRRGAAQNADVAAAEEAVAFRHASLFKRHRERDYLEGRPRLVGVRERLIAPLPCLRRSKKLLRLLRGGSRIDHSLSFIAHGQEVIQIIAIYGGHGEYRAGIHIHCDRSGSVLDIVILNGLLEMLLYIILDGRVYRRDDVISVLARTELLELAEQQLRAVGVCRPYCPTGHTGERRFVLRLYALQAVVVRTDEADKVTCKGGIRIVALCVGLQPDTAKIVFGFELAYLLRVLRLDLALDRHIP